MGQLGGLSPGGSVAVGVIVGLISTSVQSLGLTLQRKSHILEDEKGPHDLRRPPHRRRRWQLGMLMFVVSNLAGSTIQITTLPLPVLSTLQASGLVFNSICATLILGESFTRFSLAGTVLVCVGALLIALFGAIPEPAHSLDQLLELLGRQAFLLWMLGQAILVAAIIGGSKAIQIIRPRQSKTPRMRFLRGISYGLVSGILSAHSLLVAKSAVELLVRTIVDRVNQFNRWQSWVILLGLIALALSQLFYLHRGLRLCSTSVLYPLVFCMYNIIAILDGLIYFHQAAQLSLLHALLIALGTVVLLCGVLCLSWRLNTQYEQPDQVQAPTTPSSQVAQSALAPGLGLVDETGPEEGIADAEEAGETAPLLNDAPRVRTPHRSVSDSWGPPASTQSQSNEVDEIWDELEDDDVEQQKLWHRPVAAPVWRLRGSRGSPARSRQRRAYSSVGAGTGQRDSETERSPLLARPRSRPISLHSTAMRRSIVFEGERDGEADEADGKGTK